MYTYEPTDGTKYHYTATGGYLFKTEEEARLFCQMWNDHFAAMQPLEFVMAALPRDGYEDACRHFAVPAMSDAECDSYAVRYGEFVPWLDGDKIGGYAPAYCVQMALAHRRLRGIEQERARQPQPAQRVVAEKRCDCGHSSPHPMSTAQGTSCPDCYDRMSDL